VATFALVHGGQTGDSRLIVEATTNGNGVLARADQAIADDGAMVCTEHAVAGGQSFDVSMTWGRVLIGRAE